MKFPDYLLMVRRRWGLMLCCVALAVGTAALVTLRTVPRYAATINLFIAYSSREADPSTMYSVAMFTQQRAKSYADLASSRRVATAVIADLGLRDRPKALLDAVRAEAVADTVLIRVTVTDPSPRRAQMIADTWGRESARLVADLERPADGRPAPVKVSVVDSPEVPTDPVSPRPVLNLLAGLIAGLAAGLGLVVVRERLDRSVRSSEELADLGGGPVLGVAGFDPMVRKSPLITHDRSHMPHSEAYRKLRTSLRFLDTVASGKRIVVTSCQGGEGKSTIAANLAIALAQGGQRVALVDADLRRPRLGACMGVQGPGLTDVLAGRSSLERALTTWNGLPLRVLPSGPVPSDPSELLGSVRMQSLLEELTTLADIVLLDAAALLPVTDAVVLSRLCDGALLVVRYGDTLAPQVRRACDLLSGVGARLVGSVLNMVPTRGAEAKLYGFADGVPGPRAAVRAAAALRSTKHRVAAKD